MRSTSPILRALLVTHMFVSNVELDRESVDQHSLIDQDLPIDTNLLP